MAQMTMFKVCVPLAMSGQTLSYAIICFVVQLVCPKVCVCDRILQVSYRDCMRSHRKSKFVLISLSIGTLLHNLTPEVQARSQHLGPHVFEVER